VPAVPEALKTWRDKLDFLHQEEAKAVDPEQKFNLAERIKEAKSKIAELEAKPDVTSAFGGKIAGWMTLLRSTASRLSTKRLSVLYC
jgi:hypothetical protein